MRRGDVTWQYGTKVNDKGKVRCNFCNKEMGGGIYRLKEHLAWVKGNVNGFKEVPPEVKQQMIKKIIEGKRKKMQRKRDVEEIGRGYESPIDEEDDEEAEFEAQMEQARIASIQELKYRQIEIQEMYGRRDSASSNRQPQEHVVLGRGGCGPLVRFTSSILRCSFSSRPSSYIQTSTPQMVASIAEAGLGVRGLISKELAGPCLEAVVHDVDKHIAQFKVCCLGTGVTIMTDGWKDKSHRYLVNFLIGCPRGIVYHCRIDLSKKRHTGRLICAHLDKIVDEVGPENVVQVVTANVANYKKAGLLLIERRPNLYWTPCAAHCINLMVKEIGKLKRVKYCILKSKLNTRFIYNHTYLHTLMREYCMPEIVRESTTRFATTFLTIQSILVNKAELRSMIHSNEWQTDRAAMSQLGRQVETTLLDWRFWARLRVLRLSDSDDKPAMGFLFNTMRRAREAIFENNIWNEEILEIVGVETNCTRISMQQQTMCRVNRQNLYSNATLDDADIMEGVRNCIYMHELDLETQMESQWWTIHEIRTKQLQEFAVRILSQTCATSGYYTPINLDYIFRRDLANEWVSLRTPLLDKDFLSEVVADMDDTVNVAASNEGDMTMDMDDDYTQDKDEAQDDETDGTMENNWQRTSHPGIELLDLLKRLTASVSPVPVQTAPSPKTG
ncbi:hypothetical protein AMTRI_Chr04g185940 [Amborella trichopoda]